MKTNIKKAASLELQERIKNLIIKRNLKSGDVMPTENELIELLNVSRSSLREAIKSLEALHILDIKHGIGTFVGEASLEPMIRGLSFYTQLNLHQDLKNLRDILDIREILEYGFMPLALTKMDQNTLSELQKLVTNMENKARQHKFSLQDEYQIHLLAYRPLDNPLLLQYLDAFWQIYQQVEKLLPNIQITPAELALQHREYVDAIEARDLARTQRAILQYFQRIRQRLTQGE